MSGNGGCKNGRASFHCRKKQRRILLLLWQPAFCARKNAMLWYRPAVPVLPLRLRCFTLGRIKGIERPAIATPIPNLTGTTVLLDSGAKVDAKPEHMVQSALMGSVYSELMFGVDKPRVGLLNIGEEETKGNEQALATYPLLKEEQHINFIGNVEGRDINKGTVDVVVCDGFVGNVVLKFAEGLASAIMVVIKDAISKGGLMAKLGGLLLLPTMKALKKRADVTEYGGALLLGVKAPFIICHGNSKAKSITSAVRVAINFAERDVVKHIAEIVIKDEEK